MADNDIFISGIDPNIPSWASENTLKGVLGLARLDTKLSGEANNLLRAILNAVGKSANTTKLIEQAKRQASAAEKTARAQENLVKETVISGNRLTTPSPTELKQLKEMSGMRNIIAGIYAKTLDSRKLERFHADMKEAQDENNEKLSRLIQKTGVKDTPATSIVAGGFNQFRELREGMGMGIGDAIGSLAGGRMTLANGLGLLASGATAAYGAVQGGRNFALGQIEGRFDLATELRQSGLLSAIGEMRQSFVDIASTVNNSSMTLQEAAEFTRQFSRAVGVVGVSESLSFVKEMAHSRDLIGQFGLSFAQVATISGTYMETLERLGMLESISARDRDRGMMSFMEVVESTSQTLKVSMEDAAKMISEYLGRDDISAMILTAANQLSPEMQAQIGQMGNMGPLGEIIAMGAIDPTRFQFTDEYQALMNPALSGVRGIIEQMQTELAMGGNAADITARYSQQLADIVRSDPVVGQLVAMDDEVASLVSGIARFAQTAEDSTTSIQGQVQESDALERQRQELVRQRDISFERAVTNTLDRMETSGRLVTLLNSEIGLMTSQIDAINSATDVFEDLIGGVLTGSISLVNNATSMLLDGATQFLDFINSFSSGGGSSEMYAAMISPRDVERINDEVTRGIFNGLSREEIRDLLQRDESLNSDLNQKRYLISRNNEEYFGGFRNQMDYYGNMGSMTSGGAMAGLFQAANEILNNDIVGLNQAGDIEIVSVQELEMLRNQIEDIRQNDRITPEEYERIMTQVVSNLETQRSQSTDQEQKTEIARLIATMRQMMDRLD